MPYGRIVAEDRQNSITIRDYAEHGEIVLEQERRKGNPAQVWIKVDAVEDFIRELRSAVHSMKTK